MLEEDVIGEGLRKPGSPSSLSVGADRTPGINLAGFKCICSLGGRGSSSCMALELVRG